MVQLNLHGLSSPKWAEAGIALPSFDPLALRLGTRSHPLWVHAGAGNIFRGYIAQLAQDLIEKGTLARGITVLTVHDHQIVSDVYTPYDDLALRVIMKADGQLQINVVASIGEVLRAGTQFPEEWQRAVAIFEDPGLQLMSFTITEKGYKLRSPDGNFSTGAVADFATGPEKLPSQAMCIAAALLWHRWRAGALPIAMVSMDNFSHNGDRLFQSIRETAVQWVSNGLCDKGFLDYISDRSTVSFPWSMIDKITPRPDPAVARVLQDRGIDCAKLTVTPSGTYVAPFVNAEGPQYLVIEDSFPNGRPPLEHAGVLFTNRRTVDLVERMKVCTCLNPLHTALAVFGCLLGYTSIAAEMKDRSLTALVRRIGAVEGMPAVAEPGIMKPADFLREVLEQRLPNPFIPDTPQRIATDTSQKVPIRFGETIKAYAARSDLDISTLIAIPLTIAAWCRYMMGMDDAGKPMPCSADPLLETLHGHLAGVVLGRPENATSCLKPILSNVEVFGSDLYKVGLAPRVEAFFSRMVAGPGAVRRTLDEVTSGWPTAL